MSVLLEMGLVDAQGRPTAAGRQALAAMEVDARGARRGHLDNTGAPCRMDLAGHDCCYICNNAQAALIAYERERRS